MGCHAHVRYDQPDSILLKASRQWQISCKGFSSSQGLLPSGCAIGVPPLLLSLAVRPCPQATPGCNSAIIRAHHTQRPSNYLIQNTPRRCVIRVSSTRNWHRSRLGTHSWAFVLAALSQRKGSTWMWLRNSMISGKTNYCNYQCTICHFDVVRGKWSAALPLEFTPPSSSLIVRDFQRTIIRKDPIVAWV